MTLNDSLRYTGRDYRPHREFWEACFSDNIAATVFEGDKPAHAPAGWQSHSWTPSAPAQAALRKIGGGNALETLVLGVAGMALLLEKYASPGDVNILVPPLDTASCRWPYLLVRAPAAYTHSIREFVQHLGRNVSQAASFQGYPAELVTGFDRLRSYANVAVVHTGLHGTATALPGAELVLQLSPAPGGVEAVLHYQAREFSTALVTGMSTHLDTLWEQFASPETRLADVALLSAAERTTLTKDFNATAFPAGENRTVVELFREAATHHAGREALAFGSERLTYGQLNEQANQLAHYLHQTFGLRKGDRVGVFIEKSHYSIISLLAILKLGAVYVPLDVNNPSERIEHILQDAEISTLLTVSDHLFDFIGLGELHLVALDIQLAALDTPTTDPDSPPGPADEAYVIYTSGSTGRPKGVRLAHAGLANVVQDHLVRLAVQPNDRYLLFMSMSFDGSLLDIFTGITSGAALVIFPRPVLENQPAFEAALLREGITMLTVTPSFLSILNPAALAGVRTIVSAGEALTGELARRYAATKALFNGYGPSEASINATLYPVPAGSEDDRIPIGQPSANKRVYVLNQYQELVPVGVAGELCIAGLGLATGYVHDDELTAAKFVAAPQLGEERLYKSGDLARWRADGTLDYLGRRDDQIKINGYRVDLGEIENALAAYPGTIGATVSYSRDQQSGLPRLWAYLAREREPADLRPVLDEELKAMQQHLLQKVPPYMMPHAFFTLAQLPRTVNGKIDKRALDAAKALLRQQQQYAPATPMETTLYALWQEYLGVKQLSTQDNFFALGGNSLKAIQLASALQRQTNLPVQVVHLFAHPTLVSLAAFLETLALVPAAAVAAPLPDAGSYPVSNVQNRIWVLNQIEQNKTAYNITEAFRLEGALQADAFAQAYRYLVGRHEVLRTVFAIHEGQLRQRVRPATEPPHYEAVDLRTEPDALAAVRRRLQAEKESVFDLATGPLCRAVLLQTSDTTHYLVLNMHHIISDGWSMEILIREAAALYNHFVQHRSLANALPPLALQYRDWVGWQLAQASSDRYQQARQYWLDRFVGELPTVDIQTDYPRPAVKANQGREVAVTLSGPRYAQLRELAVAHTTSVYTLLVALLKVLLYRYTGQEDLIVGAIVAGRSDQQMDNLVGPFINTLVLRTRLAGQDTFAQALAAVKQTTLQAYEHQLYPFDSLVEELELDRQPNRSPLFDILINHTAAQPGAGAGFEGLHVTGLEHEQTANKFDLIFTFNEAPEELRISVNYNVALYKEARIQGMAEHLLGLAAAVAAAPEAPLAQLPYIPQAELHQLLEANNDVQRPYPAASLGELFEAQVARTPTATALVYEGTARTYQEVNELANRIAHYLREQAQVAPQDVVAIYLDKMDWTVLAVLGVAKAGAIYLPIDIKNPLERSRAILTQARCRAVVLHEYLIDELAMPGEQLLALEAMQAALAHYPATNPELTLPEHAVACIIHTSGSTGVPKGVVVEQRSVVRLVLNNNYYEVQPGSKLLQTVPYSFDVNTYEIWGTLLTGAELHILPTAKLLDVPVLKDYLLTHHINLIWFTSAWFNQLVDTDISVFASLELLMVGGDKLSYKHVNLVLEQYPALTILNCYGPTENTTYSTFYHIREPLLRDFPIGRPVSNSTVYVLDDAQQVVPHGIAGEICVGGDGLARGYYNKPELTAEKFLTVPLGGTPTRIYRTGDLGYWNFDDQLEYLGRKDFQVKVNGFRIELGDVENVMLSLPAIDKVVVVPYTFNEREQRLLGYYTTADGQPIADLSGQLRARLPEYMIPSLLAHLPELAINSNGKIDRKKLPSMADLLAPQAQAVPTEQTPKEKLIYEAFELVLGKRAIGLDDNFFEVGGNSFQAIQLTTALSRNFRMTISDVFLHRTIRNLAQRLVFQPDYLRSQLAALLDPRPAAVPAPAAGPQHAAYAAAVATLPVAPTAAPYGQLLLTGATGYLGIYLLRELLAHTPSIVHVLVRAENKAAAQERLRTTYARYFPAADYDAARLRVWAGDVAEPRLGLSEHDYAVLASEAEAILNAAAFVKHYGSPENFEQANVRGVQHLLELAAHGTPKDVHHVSTLSVGSGNLPGVPHVLFTEDDIALGQTHANQYVASKLQAEELVAQARRAGLQVSNYRVGNLIFDSESGAFQHNIADNGFYASLRSFLDLRTFPDVPLDFDFSFVDETARALVKLLENKAARGQTHHVFNPEVLTWGSLGQRLQAAGFGVRVVPADAFIEELVHQADDLGEAASNLIVRFRLLERAQHQPDQTIFTLKGDRTQRWLAGLGFAWSPVSEAHLHAMMEHGVQVGFFPTLPEPALP